MAEFSFTLADEDVPRLVLGLCAPLGLEPTISNARVAAIELVKTKVNDYERIKAQEAAAAAVSTIEII